MKYSPTPIIELDNNSWQAQLKVLKGSGPRWPLVTNSDYKWLRDGERERALKNKLYQTLAKLPNGRLVRALALRDLLKACEPERLEYADDRLILYHDTGKAELYYQDKEISK
jgi:hypothetical protein